MLLLLLVLVLAGDSLATDLQGAKSRPSGGITRITKNLSLPNNFLPVILSLTVVYLLKPVVHTGEDPLLLSDGSKAVLNG